MPTYQQRLLLIRQHEYWFTALAVNQCGCAIWGNIFHTKDVENWQERLGSVDMSYQFLGGWFLSGWVICISCTYLFLQKAIREIMREWFVLSLIAFWHFYHYLYCAHDPHPLRFTISCPERLFEWTAITKTFLNKKTWPIKTRTIYCLLFLKTWMDRA